MKPIRISIFGLTVFIVLFVFSIIVNKYKPVILGISIKFPSLFSNLNSSQPKYKDISNIISLTDSLQDSPKALVSKVDSAKKTKKPPISNSTFIPHIKSDSLRSVFRGIEFPPDEDTLLYPFFNQICSLDGTEKMIRILHYGDSQIEGDRITSYLRNQLQTKFGGSGIGLFPVVSSNPASISYACDVSDNWDKYSPLQGATGEIIHRRYGALVNFAKIHPNNSIFSNSRELDGWIELKYPNTSYPLAQQSQRCRIFYGFNTSPMMVELTQNKIVIDAEMVPPSSSLQELNWHLASPRNVIISFKSTASPEIYGISLDAGHGIAVDNIPLRGSSGLEFTKMDLKFLSDFYNMLHVKLLILQFGVNVVPNVTSNYEFYEKSFYKQLMALKKTIPNLPVLMIGVSDVSRNGDNGYESFPNIEKIRDAQKNACFMAGCAFWDSFEAMGGKNSMPSWVLANPPLAQKDFVHFNPTGAKIIAEMFYRAFILEYNKYIDYKQKNKVIAGIK